MADSEPLRHPFALVSPRTASLLRSPDVGISLFLFLASFLLYLRTCWFGFVDFDDYGFICDNSDVTSGLSLDGLWNAWTTAPQGNWTPLTWMSWMLNVSLYGISPGAFHAGNVLLHASNTVLLYWFLRNATAARGRSLATAVLFGVHPLHVESVAWIVERRDVLFLFWSLISLIAYCSYVKRPGIRNYLGTTLAFALALLSKPMAVTLPLLMLCLDFWPLRRWQPGAETPDSRVSLTWLVAEKVPWLLLSLGTGVITIAVQHASGATTLNLQLDLLSKFANALNAVVWYVKKTFLPIDLCVMYRHPRDQWEWSAVLGSAACIMGITLWATANRKRAPYLLTGWFWFLLSLLPVIGLLQVGLQAYADRYCYLPQIGLGIMCVWQIADWLSGLRAGARAGVVLTAAVTLMFGCLTVRQIEVWKNPLSLWTQGLKVDPQSPEFNYKVGELLFFARQYDAARPYLERATELDGSRSHAWTILGTTYEKQGFWQRAIDAHQRCLEINPKEYHSAKAIARIYVQLNEDHLAWDALLRATSYGIEDADLFFDQGVLLQRRGDLEGAKSSFAKAVSISPEDPGFNWNLGLVLLQLDRPEEAVVHFQVCLDADPENAATYASLGTAWEKSGHAEAALRAYRQAVLLDPQDAPSRKRIEALENAQ